MKMTIGIRVPGPVRVSHFSRSYLVHGSSYGKIHQVIQIYTISCLRLSSAFVFSQVYCH